MKKIVYIKNLKLMLIGIIHLIYRTIIMDVSVETCLIIYLITLPVSLLIIYIEFKKPILSTVVLMLALGILVFITHSNLLIDSSSLLSANILFFTYVLTSFVLIGLGLNIFSQKSVA